MAAAMPVPFAVWSLDGMLIKKSVAAHALVKKSIGSVVIKLPLKLMIVKKAANLARVCTTAASLPPPGPHSPHSPQTAARPHRG